MLNYQINDKVMLKKQHPCGSYIWTIIRTGVDIKIKCDQCGKAVMIERNILDKKIKKVVTS